MSQIASVQYESDNPILLNEPDMTLQIGMIASDGWILASESRTTELRNQLGRDDRSFGMASTESDKIWHLPNQKVALCAAGGNVPRQIVEYIVDMLVRQEDFDRANIPLSLRRAIGAVAPQVYPKPYASEKVIAVFYDTPSPKIWAVELSTLTITPCQSWTLAGDFGNPARLLPQLYYSRRSAQSLAALAVYMLSLGHECNPTFVGGPLSVLIGDLKGNANHLSDDEVQALCARWKNIDEAIAAALGTTTAEAQRHRPSS